HIIMDNLNLHCERALKQALGDEAGAALWARFTPHYTPKHASWLNPAEIELSLCSRECLAGDRIPTLRELRRRTRAWNARANRLRRRIAWRFTTTEAPARVSLRAKHYVAVGALGHRPCEEQPAHPERTDLRRLCRAHRWHS